MVGRKHFQGVTVQPMIPLDGYELILGSSIDPQFGPVLLFGSGRPAGRGLPGSRARPAAAQSHARPPDDGADADLRALCKVCAAARRSILLRWSSCSCGSASWWSSSRWIKEIDINPLLASPERLVALDARIVLHPARSPGEPIAAPRHPALSRAVRQPRSTLADGTPSPSGRSGRRTSR